MGLRLAVQPLQPDFRRRESYISSNAKPLIVLAWTAISIALPVADAPATTNYVSPGQSIQAAIDAAGSGDVIVVPDGIYSGAGNRDLTWDGHSKHLAVKSQNGPTSCIIDCQNAGRAFVFLESGQDSRDTVDGFTIVNGLASDGGAIYCYTSSPTIVNCRMVGNTADNHGGAVYCGDFACPTISNCVIRGNHANRGGGLYLASIDTLDVVQCEVTGNTADDAGGGIWLNGAFPLFRRCTISGNSAVTYGGGIVCTVWSTAEIIDSIMWSNTAANGPQIALLMAFSMDPSFLASELTVGFSDVQGGGGAAYVEAGQALNWNPGNIDSDPRFLNAAGGDFHLQSDSPCLGSGQAGVDMGAYGRPQRPKIISSLHIIGPLFISEGGSCSYSCQATFTDGSPADVTAAATWTLASAFPSGTAFHQNHLIAGDVVSEWPITISAEYRDDSGQERTTEDVTILPRIEVAIGISNSWDDLCVDHKIGFIANVTGNANPVQSYAWGFSEASEHGPTNQPTTWAKFPTERTYLAAVQVTDGVSTADAINYVTINAEPEVGEPPTGPISDVFSGSTNGLVLDPTRKDNGLVVITHGLYGSASDPWLSDLASAIEEELSPNPPNICLYDWEKMSSPRDYFEGAPEWLSDLAFIRPFGLAHGWELANWITEQIDLNRINTNKPIHLIGHSAGGFVVGQCAKILSNTVTQATMLDTPFPLRRHFEAYPGPGNVERYISSAFGKWVDQFTTDDDVDRLWLGNLPEIAQTADYYRGKTRTDLHPTVEHHSSVCSWYRATVTNGTTDGFYFSPLTDNGFHGYAIQATGLAATESGGTTTLDTGSTNTPITAFQTFGNVVNIAETYTITEAINAGVYKSIELPVGVQYLSFRYRFTTPGDGDYLTVHWGTNALLYVGLDIPLSRDDFVTEDVWIADWAGQTNDLIFKLISRGDTNAVLVIDSISFETIPDADRDGLTNTEEEALGTDPLSEDSDGDGISDYDEVTTHGTDPRLADSDGDGMNDGAEQVAGTSATNQLDCLQILNADADPGEGGASLWWSSVSDKTYRLNRATNIFLVRDTYRTVANSLDATPPTNTHSDTTATNGGPYFYWIEVE